MTQAIVEPPKNPPRIATNFADYIYDLGDRIAALTLEQAQELSEYLKDKI